MPTDVYLIKLHFIHQQPNLTFFKINLFFNQPFHPNSSIIIKKERMKRQCCIIRKDKKINYYYIGSFRMNGNQFEWKLRNKIKKFVTNKNIVNIQKCTIKKSSILISKKDIITKKIITKRNMKCVTNRKTTFSASWHTRDVNNVFFFIMFIL